MRPFAFTSVLVAVAAMLLSTTSAVSFAQEQQKQTTGRDWHPVCLAAKQQMGDYDQPFTMVVLLKPKPGCTENVIAAYKNAVKQTRKEAGNIQYQLNQPFDKTEPLMLVERWKSLEDLDDHLKQPYLKVMLKELDENLAEPPMLKLMRFRELDPASNEQK